MVTDGVTINTLIVVVILQCIQKLNHYVVHNETSMMLYVNCGGCLVSKLCLTLCNPLGYSPPGSSVHGISQARIPEWAAISFSRGCSQPRD